MARAVSCRPKFDDIADVLGELEWLNAQQFIKRITLRMVKQNIAVFGTPRRLLQIYSSTTIGFEERLCSLDL